MDKLRVYWDQKHEELREEYNDACIAIACDIGDLLAEDGHTSILYGIRGQKTHSHNLLSRESLIPLPYEGRVQWGSHIICVSEGIVYDPMLASPEPFSTYPHVAFDQVLEISERLLIPG